jgi:hypothetical protein
VDEVIEARILTKCFGEYDQQPVEYALNYCLRCRVMKSCVQKAWGWKEKRNKRDPALWRQYQQSSGRKTWRPMKTELAKSGTPQ